MNKSQTERFGVLAGQGCSGVMISHGQEFGNVHLDISGTRELHCIR